VNAANTPRIRIFVADDHPLVLRGLRETLNGHDDLEVVGEATDADSLLKALSNGRSADVVVLDLSLPGARGLDLLRRVHAEHPQSPVLVLSIHPEEPYAVRCIKAGAAGYVEKSSSPETVVDAIRTVATGRRYLSPRVTEGLVDVGAVREERRPPHETLSEREFQVMCRIAGGRTISEIAEELTLSVKTVSTYRARLLAKMGLRTNSEITRYVFAHELLPL
jgi:two-component system invasion response regulator UvrY